MNNIGRIAVVSVSAVVVLMLALSRSGDDNSIPVVDVNLVRFTNGQDGSRKALLVLSNTSSINLIRGSSYTVDSSGKNGPAVVKSFLITPSSSVLMPGMAEVVETMCPERGDKWVVTFGFSKKLGKLEEMVRDVRSRIFGRDSNGEDDLFVYISPTISSPAARTNWSNKK